LKRIGGILGRSAIGAIREQMAKVSECVEVFSHAQKAYINGDFDIIDGYSENVEKLEHEADIIKESIKSSISRSIFASANRNDLLSLVHKTDDIADACQDVVRFLTLHRMKLSQRISGLIEELTEKTSETAGILDRAIALTSMYEEQEILPAKIEEIYEMLSRVKHGEWETDEIQISFVREVFETGGEYDTPDFFFLMNLGRRLVVIADHMENVADGLQGLISR
jgi:uncharacterized protein